MVGTLSNAGVMALLSMVVAVAPMVMGIAYAIWPSEARLALMRPLSLAGIFSALGGLCAGVINTLVFIGRSPDAVPDRFFYTGLSESLVPPLVGFGCLTVAWLCVALGMRRQPI